MHPNHDPASTDSTGPARCNLPLPHDIRPNHKHPINPIANNHAFAQFSSLVELNFAFSPVNVDDAEGVGMRLANIRADTAAVCAGRPEFGPGPSVDPFEAQIPNDIRESWFKVKRAVDALRMWKQNTNIDCWEGMSIEREEFTSRLITAMFCLAPRTACRSHRLLRLWFQVHQCGYSVFF